MVFSTSDRVRKLANFAHQAKFDQNQELVKLIKLLALKLDESALNDFEQVLTSKLAEPY